MPRKRRSFSPAFKTKVALDAHKGLKAVGELAKQHRGHPTQIALWKRQLLDGVEGVFEGSSPPEQPPVPRRLAANPEVQIPPAPSGTRTAGSSARISQPLLSQQSDADQNCWDGSTPA
jgi:transposase-like protein